MCEFNVRILQIQKWTLLERDFSIPGGELGTPGIITVCCFQYYHTAGPTLKVRRFVLHKKYASTIETLYRN